MNDHEGRLAVVAGGAGAIGEGIVGRLLARGAHVVVPSRDPARVDALRDALPADPGDWLHGVVGDIGSFEGAEAVASAVVDRYGVPDTVVASVGGWWQGAPLTGIDAATWDRVLASNLTTHVALARAFLSVMAERAGAAYLVISGTAAEEPTAGSSPVSVAGAGVLMLVRTLAAELHDSPVRVNALVLGPIATRTRSKARPEWLTADEVGELAAHVTGPLGAMLDGTVIRAESRPPAAPAHPAG